MEMKENKNYRITYNEEEVSEDEIIEAGTKILSVVYVLVLASLGFALLGIGMNPDDSNLQAGAFVLYGIVVLFNILSRSNE